MDIPVFELSSFLHPGETFHLARVNIISRQDLSFHTHDYAELLWIEKGSGYHLVNGERLRIGPGDLIMIRPQDAHTYAASTKGGGITLINIAFPVETLHHFRERYFPDSGQYFWSTEAMPYRIQLPAEILHQLSARAFLSYQTIDLPILLCRVRSGSYPILCPIYSISHRRSLQSFPDIVPVYPVPPNEYT